MRSTLVLLFLLAAGSSFADPLIDIPTARKLPFGTFKLEYAESITGGGTQLGWLDAGIGKSFEATVREEEIDGTRIRPTADLMYSFISALPGVSPGISFGMQDMANTTQDGRRGYMAITIRDTTETFDYEAPYDFTMGISAGKKVLPFAGLTLPLSGRVKLLMEHNGYRPAGGVQYALNRSLSLRFLVRGPRTFGDVVWSSRF